MAKVMNNALLLPAAFLLLARARNGSPRLHSGANEVKRVNLRDALQ